MTSLQINTGQISLQILDDDGNERGIFKFNPEDIESAKRIVQLKDELLTKQEEFEQICKNAKTTEEQFEVLSSLVDYFNKAIDNCFGEGSSEILFGNAKTLSMYDDFISGITVYYKKASDKRTEKYKRKSGK